jgi:hypothetical protein
MSSLGRLADLVTDINVAVIADTFVLLTIKPVLQFLRGAEKEKNWHQ